MNAKELHDLTAPLFAKHPSAKPEGLYCDTRYIGCEVWRIDEAFHTQAISSDFASLIIQGHLAQWLAEKTKGNIFTVSAPATHISPIYKKWGCGAGVKNERDTFLEALVAACMEVEQ
jgi:hypothetical protein